MSRYVVTYCYYIEHRRCGELTPVVYKRDVPFVERSDQRTAWFEHHGLLTYYTP